MRLLARQSSLRLSDGIIFEFVNSFKASQKKRVKLQCEMSRKVTFSNTWKKAKYQVQNLHARIASARAQRRDNIRPKRSILDKGWYELHRQLEYKQLWRGG